MVVVAFVAAWLAFVARADRLPGLGASHLRQFSAQRRGLKFADKDRSGPALIARNRAAWHLKRATEYKIEADFATPVTYTTTGGAIISTRDAVTFGFGLEQVSAADRSELLKRSLSYLVPTSADTTPPTIVGFKWPLANSTATNIADA